MKIYLLFFNFATCPTKNELPTTYLYTYKKSQKTALASETTVTEKRGQRFSLLYSCHTTIRYYTAVRHM